MYEYKVITIKNAKDAFKKDQERAKANGQDALNWYAAQGWRLIALRASTNGDQAVYWYLERWVDDAEAPYTPTYG